MIFRVTDLTENVARGKRFVADVQAGHGEFDCGELVVVVEDGEVVGETCRGGFATEQTRAERMKCGKPGTLGRNAGAKEKVGDASLHLFGGLVCKGHRENVFGRHTGRNEIRHAKWDGAGFA